MEHVSLNTIKQDYYTSLDINKNSQGGFRAYSVGTYEGPFKLTGSVWGSYKHVYWRSYK